MKQLVAMHGVIHSDRHLIIHYMVRYNIQYLFMYCTPHSTVLRYIFIHGINRTYKCIQ